MLSQAQCDFMAHLRKYLYFFGDACYGGFFWKYLRSNKAHQIRPQKEILDKLAD